MNIFILIYCGIIFVFIVKYKSNSPGPKIQVANRNNVLNPAKLIIGPLINSPMSSPEFITLIRIENCSALIFRFVISMEVARRTLNNPPFRNPNTA